MDAETALELVKKGATLLLLDVPQNTLFGIDTQVLVHFVLHFTFFFRSCIFQSCVICRFFSQVLISRVSRWFLPAFTLSTIALLTGSRFIEKNFNCTWKLMMIWLLWVLVVSNGGIFVFYAVVQGRQWLFSDGWFLHWRELITGALAFLCFFHLLLIVWILRRYMKNLWVSSDTNSLWKATLGIEWGICQNFVVELLNMPVKIDKDFLVLLQLIIMKVAGLKKSCSDTWLWIW